MMLYVNYYDRDVKLPDDNPTIGLLLCPAEVSREYEQVLERLSSESDDG